MNFDNSNSSFTRIGSFRQATITERLADPQVSFFFSWIRKYCYNDEHEDNFVKFSIDEKWVIADDIFDSDIFVAAIATMMDTNVNKRYRR